MEVGSRPEDTSGRSGALNQSATHAARVLDDEFAIVIENPSMVAADRGVVYDYIIV